VPVFDPNTEVAVTASLDNYVQKTENLTISEGDNQEVNFLLESLFDNAGVVSLTIARSADEKNIEVTWDDAATPQPQIFMRKGDGSGSYLNSDPVINWTKVAEDGALLQGIDPLEFAYANGKLTHLGQVGAGSQGEVYYKALVKGKNPGDIPQGSLTTCFENAQAVGKFNINLEIGKDMIISTPLLPQNNDRKFSTIVGNQLDGSGATIFGYIDGYKPAYKDGGNWLGALAPLGFDEKRGYWIVGVKAQTILTLVGLVANTPTININLSLLGDNLVGHPYPNPITFDNSGLAQILAEDKSVVWGFIDGYKPATLNAGGVWGGSLVGLKLNPGQGYWILIKSKNDQNDKDNVDWQYPCQ
jgi:hypothetical protein